VTYQESLAWLYSTQQFGIKLGLENTYRLLEAQGNPQDGLKIFHVAGTNGKGSVCAMIAAVLRAAGFRTGLYTSPHLVDFRERIQVDGAMIDRESVAAGLSRLRSDSAGWDHCPTFFEIATVLALEHFAASECDFVVLETGMGGRLDATNTVSPILSVITPIAMDHAEWLGDTIPRIASEKAGIIKPGLPVVSAPQSEEAARVLIDKASASGSPLTFVESPWPDKISLAGHHQAWNAALAELAIRNADLEIDAEIVSRAFAGVEWSARFQRLAERVILDGAHNPHAIATLVAAWNEAFPNERATIIFGALIDKDYGQMIRLLEEIAAEFWFVPISSARTAMLESFPEMTGVRSLVFQDVPSALDAIRASAHPVLITGSLFLAGEVLAAFADPRGCAS